MAKRPDVRRAKPGDAALTEWSKDLTRREITEAMHQGPPPEHKETMAADRLGALDQWDEKRNSYPTNNFALTALILGALIIVIGLAYAMGLVN